MFSRSFEKMEIGSRKISVSAMLLSEHSKSSDVDRPVVQRRKSSACVIDALRASASLAALRRTSFAQSHSVRDSSTSECASGSWDNSIDELDEPVASTCLQVFHVPRRTRKSGIVSITWSTVPCKTNSVDELVENGLGSSVTGEESDMDDSRSRVPSKENRKPQVRSATADEKPRSPFTVRRVKSVKPSELRVTGRRKSKHEIDVTKYVAGLKEDAEALAASNSHMAMRRERRPRGAIAFTGSAPSEAAILERFTRKPAGSGRVDSDTEEASDRRKKRMNRGPQAKSVPDGAEVTQSCGDNLNEGADDQMSAPVAAAKAMSFSVAEEKREDANNNATRKADAKTLRREWLAEREAFMTSGVWSTSVDGEQPSTIRRLSKAENTMTHVATASILNQEPSNIGPLREELVPGVAAVRAGSPRNVLNLSIAPTKPGQPTTGTDMDVAVRLHPPTRGKVSDSGFSGTRSLDDTLPDLPSAPKTPKPDSADRLRRDFKLSSNEVRALRQMLRKADLYEQDVRDKLYALLKLDVNDNEDSLLDKVLCDQEVESLKEKLFLSRKELDSYISFTKKMEREKRQIVSEKEELVTKLTWHEKRLNRFETDNKALKVERAELMNQIYELRGKTNVPVVVPSGRQKCGDASAASAVAQPELEISKQRLIYEADAFAQERTKLIKERQRLDEEVRKVQIQCVSLLAQLQHSEKTVEELQQDKENLKGKVAKLTKALQDDSRRLQEKLAGGEESLLIDRVNSRDAARKRETFSALMRKVRSTDEDSSDLKAELVAIERKYEELQREHRSVTESKIKLDHELIALNDTVSVLRSAKEETEARASEVDGKYRDALSDIKALTDVTEKYESERMRMQREIESLSSSLADMQRNAVQLESDQDAFKKFLDKLSMELEEKLGEENVSQDTEAETLQEQAEVIGRQIVAHLTPPRKLQDDYEEIKQERNDLEEEIKYLKYALSSRMEIKNMQGAMQKCDCSREKEILKVDLGDALKRVDALEDEVKRLHSDKQSLLMSFLNLQAAQRSRRPHRSHRPDRSDYARSSEDELSNVDDDSGDTDEDDDYDSRTCESRSSRTSSCRSMLSDVRETVGDDVNERVSRQRTSSYASESIATAADGDSLADMAKKLEEQRQLNRRLEDERAEMLDSLCCHVDENKALKEQLEELNSGRSAPPARDIAAGSTPDRCANCQESTLEVRKYLSILEELTEDKLRLEKALDDVQHDKEKCQLELERVTDDRAKIELDLEAADNEKEHSLLAAKEETQFLLANIQTLEHENAVLEENLQKLREDKAEILDKLRLAEEDRYGFIRTITLISEQKESVELELEQLAEENKQLKLQLQVLDTPDGTSSALSYESCSDFPKETEPETLADVASESPRRRHTMGRSVSVPAAAQPVLPPSSQTQEGDRAGSRVRAQSEDNANCCPSRKINGIPELSEVDDAVDKLQSEVEDLKYELGTYKCKIDAYKAINTELCESLDFANALLKEEKILNRRLSEDFGVSFSPSQIAAATPRPRVPLTPNQAKGIDVPSSKELATSLLCSSVDEQFRGDADAILSQETLRNDSRTRGAPRPASCQARTLSFQVSFKGVPVLAKTDF